MTHRPSPQRLVVPIVWTALLALMLLIAWQSVEGVRRGLLNASAERTAVGYAHFIGESIPGMTGLLATGAADTTTLADLERLRRLGDVFRFKLFDREGRRLLVSDDLGAADPLAGAAPATLGDHHGGNAHVAAIVLGGENYVTIEDGRAKAGRPDLYAEAYVPLIQDGELIGVIEVYVDQSDLAVLIDGAFFRVASTVGLMIALIAGVAAVQAGMRLRERARSEATIRHMAEHDTLCGALNRASFTAALEREARRVAGDGKPFSVLCIDLDRFKEVNDTLGHAAGDLVLQEVARRLREVVRPNDLVARLGGDEFALLLSGVTGAAELEQVGHRVLDTLAEPVEADGQSVPCGASVGAARFGEDATTVGELLHRADLAMYRSKQDGRGRFSFYDPTLDHAIEERRQLTLELRAAIASDALAVHFQPLFSSGVERKLVGYEALMRWPHPKRGMVPPSEFIPLAEETGLIDSLGSWMLDAACAEAASWSGGERVAVNLSAAQFRGRRPLTEQVRETLARTGLPAERLELEITESLLMSDAEEVLGILSELTAMGVRIALDDFGTGYSSLSYLWRFPFDKLKIDRSFTQRLDKDEKVGTIVRSIITLAHSMNISVNAEGVETESQRQCLLDLGCDELQGFLLGRPAPFDASDRHDRAA